MCLLKRARTEGIEARQLFSLLVCGDLSDFNVLYLRLYESARRIVVEFDNKSHKPLALANLRVYGMCHNSYVHANIWFIPT